MLQSNDNFQIRSAGDFDQICLKLDHSIHITCFTDPSSESLSIDALHDLRISKMTNKDSLTNAQWTQIRDYFDGLVQQSDRNTSLCSIVESVQDYLSKILNEDSKSRSSSSLTTSRTDASTPAEKFRGADLIFNRLTYDPTIDHSKVTIGYEDRFTGIQEIAFNDFKKVHDDKCGIPMHRIRYYKIDGEVVWDRVKKVDILTGNKINVETPTDIGEQPMNLVEGMYEFDQSNHRWNLCPHVNLASDNTREPSSNNMCIPERCQIITWNILFDYYHSDSIYTYLRYPEILKTLKSFLPDIICLQEITLDFLTLLMRELWVQENNYYIIIMESIVNRRHEQTFGQIILTKNFRARAFTVCPVQLFENASRRRYTKEYIIARFGLNSQVTIDLVNLHLHSDCSHNAVDKRCQALKYLFQTMDTQNYMLIGDFNFGDHHWQEQYLLQKYQYQIHDLWRDIYDIEENPGYTFDPLRNSCAKITSKSSESHRLDRYLLHTLHNLSYSIEHMNMIGLETISVDSQSNKRLNQSDHFGLKLKIHFRTRPVSHRSMLAIALPMKMDSMIETFREQYDPMMKQSPLHVKLFWPFFELVNNENDEESILLPLRLLLGQYQSFEIIVDEVDSSADDRTIMLKMNLQSAKSLKALHAQIQQLFPQCLLLNEQQFNPHIIIAQFDTSKRLNQAKSTLNFSNSIRFPVQYISVLQRTDVNDTSPFSVTHQLPLGPVLEPISRNQLYGVDSSMKEFFTKMNLYKNEQSYERKCKKSNRLSLCFEEILNENTLHCYRCLCFSYGSFRLGLHGDDLDIVFVVAENGSLDNPTVLDQTFLRLRYDSSALTNHVSDLLEKQISHFFNNEIIYSRRIQAVYPILSILFTDQTKVEIFIEIKEASILKETNLLSNFHEPIHGVHDIERLVVYVRYPPIFQYLLTFIRTWAQNTGLYGQVYGYLGGYSWAILCAYICHQHLPKNQICFSIEQLFDLIKLFFSFYAHFNWPHDSIHLPMKLRYLDETSEVSRGSMRILCPTPPFNNSARSTTTSTRDLIIQGFQQAYEILEKTANYEDILRLPNQFPHKTIQSIIQLTLSGQTINELEHWLGYMKSRLAHFSTDCEEECHLFVQTDTKTEKRDTDLERFYSVGFQVDEQVLSRHRQFYYVFNKFLDEFKIDMLSNTFARFLTAVRPIRHCQQHLLRSLSTADTSSTQTSSNERETGIVKRFSKDKGYGFISKNSDGSDCFVHFKNINSAGFKTLEQGQEVEFSIVQGEKGVEARDVTITKPSSSRSSFFGGSSNNDSTSSKFGFGANARNQSSSTAFSFGGTKSSQLHSTGRDSTSAGKSFDFTSGLTSSKTDNLFSSRRTAASGEREIGSVKRWTEERGFGFIRRNNGGPDLFCHARSLKNGLRSLTEGQTVQFTIQQTDKGEEARNVTIFDENDSSSDSRENINPEQRYTGTVRRWLPEKGYGFLRRDDAGTDVFIHLSNLPEGTTSLEEGQQVEFNIVSGGKGVTAENLTINSEA
ncbi:unnamed protein product [Adineta ricciae]|uniref:CSD domain-containing protein n=2 Tax=Adineta ricciae TaxID=249248 RepID=A0A813Y4Y8_ADIRI|nr:unnamed protein product [Adineta ricciae]